MKVRVQPTGAKWHQQRKSADEFRWHLEPQWRSKFSHDWWWRTKPGEQTLESAAWEVLRRHPRARTIIQSASNSSKARRILNESVAYIRPRIAGVIVQHGLRSWDTLSREQREEWGIALKELAPQKGIRRQGEQGSGLTIFWNDRGSGRITRFKRMRRLAMRGIRLEGRCDPKKALAEARVLWQSEWSEWCFSEICSGKVPVMLYPDALRGNEENVKKLLNQLAAKFEGKQGRKAENEWLGTIAEFEAHFLPLKDYEKTNDQLFHRYRKMIREWRWPPTRRK
jgi:hypothetical protein